MSEPELPSSYPPPPPPPPPITPPPGYIAYGGPGSAMPRGKAMNENCENDS